MALLYIPAARVLSEDTASAEMMPFVEGRSFVVGIELSGSPGFDTENTERRELVPHIKLL
jgi:hypothetical protein